ncbi:MAG TPA: replication-associated recombination protein A [Clostridiales bacterium]|jgi:putative ATPase|nr:replication-associated recombination protein A [Clostridiales bacterium]
MMPLSTRLRPETLDEFIGQSHFFYPGSLVYNAIKRKTFGSAIFFGPSGTGKTTLARLIAKEMDSEFYELNASVAGTRELKEIIGRCQENLFNYQREHTYLYVDEFHRWNKLQQDSLLKALEEGLFRFIGSTTENPWFAINNAVLSRIGAVYEFKRLSPDEIEIVLTRALTDQERGLGSRSIEVKSEALTALADLASGDARVALDALGFIADNLNPGQAIDLAVVGEAVQKPVVFYDKRDDKYNLLSALQKSIRGTDPDAALHYLARLIDGGADPQMIGRRLMVIASEDIGMAYPQAISIVTACVQAALLTGLPEARIQLAQAVILLASCPKSNSVIMAIDEALNDLKKYKTGEIPPHLMDTHYSGAKKRGFGGYKYPHAYGGYVKQDYLPELLRKAGAEYYKPTGNGKEGAFRTFLEEIRKRLKNHEDNSG